MSTKRFLSLTVLIYSHTLVLSIFDFRYINTANTISSSEDDFPELIVPPSLKTLPFRPLQDFVEYRRTPEDGIGEEIVITASFLEPFVAFIETNSFNAGILNAFKSEVR